MCRLDESFPMHIFLQNLASIQLITSLVEFARSPRTDPPGFTDVKHKIHPKACHASDWANGWINEFIREMQAKDNYNPAKALERTKPLGDDETSLIIDKETKKWVAISQPAPESS